MKYTYSKLVEASRLELEIRNSAIVTALDYITTLGDVVDVLFKAELSIADKAILDGIIESHVPTPIAQGPDKVIINNPAPLEITATSPKNEHCIEPWGAVKGYMQSRGDLETGDFVCSIVLSNKSEDGLTFTYNSDITIVPTVGNYVFQRYGSKRSWITAIDTVNKTLTFELPNLSEGSGFYTKGYYIDCKVPDWKPIMYLWGMTLSLMEYDENNTPMSNQDSNFVELSIVDIDDLFKNDDVCMSLFGVPASGAIPYITAMGWEDIGEYGHWTKYYDESWVVNCEGKYIKSPDGSPGELLPGLYLRLSFFATEDEICKNHIYLDYYPTSK